MLEFYPMPTNLNHGVGFYPHQQNHGGARFLDNPNTTANTPSLGNNNINTNHNNNAINYTQQQQMNGTTAIETTPTNATCLSSNNNNNITNTNNNNNNKNLLTSVSASTTASLTAQIISANLTSSTPTTTITTSPPTHSCTPNHNSVCANTTANGQLPNAANSTITALSTAPTTAAAVAVAAAAPQIAPTTSLSALSTSSSSKLSADCSGRTDVIGHIKCEKNYEMCEGCGQKIHDRYIMNVGESNWHEQCLACCYCGIQLHHSCYVRNSKLYCKLDYERLFAIKCAACCHPILPQDLVMRPVPSLIFHLPCFVCFACRLPLQKGEQFLLREGQLFCFRHDLEKEMYLAAAQHCGFVTLDEDDLLRPRDGRRGPKRPRTILTSQQRKQFKASFDQSPKPCRKVREALAKDTGLSVRVVQVWFQNQRAKMKKIQRKAKNGNGTNSGRSGDDKDNDKDEKSIKQESGSASESSYLGLDSTFASQPLNPNLPFSPDDYPANSNDSFCSSDLSLDGSNFDQLDDDGDSLSLNNLELQSTCSSGNQHSNAQDMIANLSTNLINPIDKLYLMQNSYFSSEQ
ncbi:LIM homeobox transcription factor 1-beta [Teleopsis dalmanni]|uniref:LIM homeobox transcription factor 1-beta n=1 Tax=Teleopsis dalmanni TaxID=139649 RepID=UPI0018CD8522|nr:LIM homeobox transcription factor 1-beta [Teleopsis dalmanni]